MLRRSIQSFRRFLLDRMVLRPSRHPLEHAPQQRETFRFNGQSVECFHRKNFPDHGPPELLVLKFPGTAGRAERSTEFPATLLGETRTSLWTLNPPGYGRSGGRARLDRIADTAIEFWNHIVTREAEESTPIWLCGNSLGCVTAMHVGATMQPPPAKSGIIMRNPPPLVSVVKRAALRYPLGSLVGPVAESVPDSMNALLTAKRLNLPAVFLQSELDSLVPVEHQDLVMKNYGGPWRKVLLEGLGHGGIATESHERLIGDAVWWLWEQTKRDVGCASAPSRSHHQT